MSRFASGLAAITIAATATLSTLCLTGCDTKEEIIDVQTPAGDMEVNRDRMTGDVEVDVDKE